MVPGDWWNFYLGSHLWRQSGSSAAILHLSFSKESPIVSARLMKSTDSLKGRTGTKHNMMVLLYFSVELSG